MKSPIFKLGKGSFQKSSEEGHITHPKIIKPQFMKCKVLKGDQLDSTNYRHNTQKKHFEGSPSLKRFPPVKFYQEMNKHGLMDKIVHIDQLNNYFEAEFGSPKKINDSVNKKLYIGENKSNTLRIFPFHKRTRSNSPFRGDSFLNLDTNKNPIPINSKIHPVVLTRNFVMGKTVRQLEVSPKEEEELWCGLSTGPTKDDKADEVDNWMYQRINAEKEDENESIGEEGVSFLQMLNQAR